MTNLDKEYQRNECKGRTKFKQLADNGNNMIEFTNDKFNHIDAFFTATSTNYIYGVEIKNRQKKYDCYSTLIIETIKYDAMKTLQDNNDTNECILVYFFEDIAYILKWTTINTLLSNNIVSVQYKWLPDSTVNKHKMVQKTCIEVPKEYTYKYIFDSTLNKWKQVQKP